MNDDGRNIWGVAGVLRRKRQKEHRGRGLPHVQMSDLILTMALLAIEGETEGGDAAKVLGNCDRRRVAGASLLTRGKDDFKQKLHATDSRTAGGDGSLCKSTCI